MENHQFFFDPRSSLRDAVQVLQALAQHEKSKGRFFHLPWSSLEDALEVIGQTPGFNDLCLQFCSLIRSTLNLFSHLWCLSSDAFNYAIHVFFFSGRTFPATKLN